MVNFAFGTNGQIAHDDSPTANTLRIIANPRSASKCHHWITSLDNE